MKTKIVIFIFFILNLSFTIENCEAQWSLLLNNSPGVNTFYAIAADSQYVYAGTSAPGSNTGLFRSSNNGSNWTLISLQSSGVKNLKKCGSNLIAVTYNNSAIMFSTDKGISWSTSGLNFSSDLYVSGSIAYAVSQSVVRKSTDFGINWTQLTASGIISALYTAGKDTFTYASTPIGVIFRISNNTNSWININSGLPTPVEYSICDILTLNNSVFCAVYATDGTGVNSGIYRTTTFGNNWSKVTASNQGLGFNFYYLSSVDSNVIYFGGNRLLVSSNNGNNWYSKLGNLPAGIIINDITSNADFVFVATNNGVWRMSKADFLSGIKTISTSIPDNFRLEQNYPNPFNSTTKIQFNIPPCHSEVGESFGIPIYRDRNPLVVLTVFDILGKEVATLVNESLQPGTYETTFDASNLTSGIYFYQLRSDNFIQTKKLTLIK